MALIVNIDTATENASVALCNNSSVLVIKENSQQKDHASFLHIAIEALFKEAKCEMSELNAIAVTNGPGSYTGLRVGMATAKGLCYALKVPLILANTLQVMALAAKQELVKIETALEPKILLCPMIDARRMEVFMAMYDWQLDIIEAPVAKILSDNSFEVLVNQPIYFFGSGSEKLKKIKQNNCNIIYVKHNAGHLGEIAFMKYQISQFSELAYSQPDYLKEFYEAAGSKN